MTTQTTFTGYDGEVDEHNNPIASHATPNNIRNYTFDQLLEVMIGYQYCSGIDPAVGDVFEAVGEALRRVWDDRNARI